MLDELMVACQQMTREVNSIYLHWSGCGDYDSVFSDYHINITGDGKLHIGDLDEVKSHTWRRNSHSIGVSLSCAAGSWITAEGVVHHGLYPPTSAQIETMARVVAILCIELGISLDCVKSHNEVAQIDGYGIYDNDPDMRWDLYGLEDTIRGKARWYANSWGITYL